LSFISHSSGNILVKNPGVQSSSPTHPTTLLSAPAPIQRPSLVFLDVGLVARASQHDYHLLKLLLLAVAQRDSRKAASLMVEHAKEKRIGDAELGVLNTSIVDIRTY
jgi:predicted unusual protein kinase regulating ubiquinone biosynthesis (AarF/ABC1/UbiB family)